MDIISHALWGYAVMRWRGPEAAKWGALFGAGPDLLYSGGAIAERLSRGDFKSLSELGGSDPTIWKKDGPPLTPALIVIYNRYYKPTHSLILLGGIALA